MALGSWVAATSVSCAPRAERQGTVRLALTIPPGGPSVNSVQWRITTSLGAVVRSGTIQTGDLNATASVDTSCPAGSGYTITLSATASDNSACSGSSAPFNVAAGAFVPVSVQLVCGGGVPMQGVGSVIAKGTVVAGDNCPLLTSWEVSSLRTTAGSSINVSATASDADSADVLTFLWTATSGSFANPSAPTTIYNCGFSGRADLSVIVSDGHLPTPCQTARSFSVYCVPSDGCGNGIIYPGEQCDPPNGTWCSPVCQFVPPTICGDGIVEPGEECDPPNNANCSLTCHHPVCGNYIIEPGEVCDPASSPGCNSSRQLAVCGDGIIDSGEECDPPNGTTCRPGCIAARCGDGVVDPGETCDPPNGTTCNATCQLGPLAVCGDGIIEPGEQCDPPNTAICDSTCHQCLGPLSSCDLCERADTADCPAALNTVPAAVTCTWGCLGFPAGSPARTHCQALLACIIAQHCSNADDPTPCLCGSLSAMDCASSGPPTDAPCAAEYAAAAADTPSITVFAQFSNPNTPVGIADNGATCDIDSGCACR